MNALLAAGLCVLVIELALRMPFGPTLAAMRSAGSRAVRVVRARGVSDHWKERAMGAYARTTFRGSVSLAAMVALLLGAALLLAAAAEAAAPGFQSFLLAWPGIALSGVVSILYLLARRTVGRRGRLRRP